MKKKVSLRKGALTCSSVSPATASWWVQWNSSWVPRAIGMNSGAKTGRAPMTFSARRRTTTLQPARVACWASTKKSPPIPSERK